jgi:hypothetical protein
VSISDSRLRWGLVAALTVALAAAVFALQPRPFFHDASLFVVLGHGLLSGQVPYGDLFDHKPPGIYMVGALAWLLDSADTNLSMQALSVVATAITATACGWIVSAVFSRFWAGVATALSVAAGLSLPVAASGGGTSELFSEVGLAVCAACVVAMILLRKGVRWPAVAGASFAWAFGCSLLAVAAAPALAVLWLTIPIDGSPYPLSRSNWRTWIGRRVLDRRLGAAIAGAAAVSLAIWLPIIVSGSVPQAVDAIVGYNNLYRRAAHLSFVDWAEVLAVLWALWLPTALVCLVPTGRWLPLGFRLLARSNLFRASVLWVLAALVLQLYGRRVYMHYLQLFVPPLGLIVGCVLAGLRLERPKISPRIAAVALSAGVVAGLGYAYYQPVDNPPLAQNLQLAESVRANSAPGDTIFVWGYDPDLYLEADRSPAGPYINVLPLLLPGYGQEAVAKQLDHWQAHPPRVIVCGVAGSDLFFLYTLEDPRRPTLTPLADYVHAHYQKVASLPGGDVWQYSG